MPSSPLRALVVSASALALLALSACTQGLAEDEEVRATESALVVVCDAAHTGSAYDSACAPNEFCGKRGCTHKKPLGEECNRSRMCSSNFCVVTLTPYDPNVPYIPPGVCSPSP